MVHNIVTAPGRWRLGLAAIAVATALAIAAVAHAATITDAGMNSSSQTQVTTYWQPDELLGIIWARVESNTYLKNTKAYYDPGPPYVVSNMLPVVIAFDYEGAFNTAGVTWNTAFDGQVAGVGSINGYWVNWQYQPWPPVPGYNLGCSILPNPKQCKRAVPDWLIDTNKTLSLTYSHYSALPWAPVYGTNSGTIQYVWW